MEQREEGELLLPACSTLHTAAHMTSCILQTRHKRLLINNLRKQFNVRENSEYISQGTLLDPHF